MGILFNRKKDRPSAVSDPRADVEGMSVEDMEAMQRQIRMAHNAKESDKKKLSRKDRRILESPRYKEKLKKHNERKAREEKRNAKRNTD